MDETREQRARRIREEAFGDAVYEVWRSGGNPDHVSRDDIADAYYECYDREETAERVVRDTLRSDR